MTWGEHSHDSPEDPLEPLLRSAAWPEAHPERFARLERRWRIVSAARRRNRWFAAAAAVAALAAGLAIAVLAQRLVSPNMSRPLDSVPVAIVPPHRPQVAIVKPVADQTISPVSRPATEYEKMFLRLQVSRNRVPPVEKDLEENAVGKLVDQLARNPAMDIEALVQPWMTDRERCEQQLARWISQSQGPRREAAIRLLGYVGSARSLPLLGALAKAPSTHRAAILAAARLADPMAIKRCAVEEQDPQLQKDLFAELLRRNDSRSVAVYLHAIEQGGPLAAAALAAVDGVRVPANRFFAALDAPRMADRFAAAQVLGRIEDPQVTVWLIAMVSQGAARKEVLSALMYRSDSTSQTFLAQASRDPMLYGVMLAAAKGLGGPRPPWSDTRTVQ